MSSGGSSACWKNAVLNSKAAVEGANLSGRLRAFAGAPGFMRRPFGPGWALVGDAGYFKDPLTAHGITDALRDAELLARAVLASGPHAMARYSKSVTPFRCRSSG
jgi:flavin-dependent dehydrogenase